MLQVYKDYIKFKTEQTKTTEHRKTKKNRFSKDHVKNAGLYKSVFKKIVTTHE